MEGSIAHITISGGLDIHWYGFVSNEHYPLAWYEEGDEGASLDPIKSTVRDQRVE